MTDKLIFAAAATSSDDEQAKIFFAGVHAHGGRGQYKVKLGKKNLFWERAIRLVVCFFETFFLDRRLRIINC